MAEVTITLANRGGASFRVLLPCEPPAEADRPVVRPVLGEI